MKLLIKVALNSEKILSALCSNRRLLSNKFSPKLKLMAASSRLSPATFSQEHGARRQFRLHKSLADHSAVSHSINQVQADMNVCSTAVCCRVMEVVAVFRKLAGAHQPTTESCEILLHRERLLDSFSFTGATL